MTWVIGARGLLGGELATGLAATGEPVLATGREVDIRDPVALDRYAAAAGGMVDSIVNCAGLTAVEAAEDDEAGAFALNAAGAANVARLAARLGAALVHVSTDFVFDGLAGRPYLEADPVAPLSAYGRSKAEGERLVLEACPAAVVVRSAWLYGIRGRSFVRAILGKLAAGKPFGVVTDEAGSPTSAAELARAIASVVAAPRGHGGLYHFAGAGVATRLDLALELRRLALERGLLAYAPEIAPIRQGAASGKARRPAFAPLDSSRFSRDFGLAPAPWRAALAAFVDGLLARGAGFALRWAHGDES